MWSSHDNADLAGMHVTSPTQLHFPLPKQPVRLL